MKKYKQYIHHWSITLVLVLMATLCSTAQDGFIKGRISDATGVLPGINVFIDGPASTIVLSDIDGSYSAKVPVGEYSVSIDVMGYGEQSQRVVVREGQMAIADFELALDVGGVSASATLIEQSTLDVPATVIIVSNEQIQNRGYQNLQDLLEDMPEVEIHKKSMPEFRDNTVMRGIAGNEKFIIFMNGVRISSGTADPHAVYANYALMNVDKVEVLLGPASAIYGVDAYSGLINIITKDGKGANGIQATASYGMYGTTDNQITIGGEVDEVSYVVSGSWFQSNEPDFNNLYQEDFGWYNEEYLNEGIVRGSFFTSDEATLTDIDDNFAMGSSAYSISSRINFKQFELGFYQNSEVHSSSLSIDPEYSLYTASEQFGVQNRSIYAKHTYKSAEEDFILLSTVSLHSMEGSTNSALRNIYTGYETGYRYQNSKVARISEQMTWIINDNHSLVAGASFEDIVALPRTGDLPFQPDRSTSLSSQNQYYFGTNVQDINGNDLSITQDFYYLQYINTGGFAQFQSKLFDDFLEVTAGARYDYNTRYGAAFNPRIGLVMKPTDAIRVKLLYGEAFLSPSPWKAYQHYGSFTQVRDENGDITGLFAPFLHLPNPDLKPENLTTFELGASYSLNSTIVFSVDGFYNNSTNFIDYYTQDLVRTSFKGVNVAYIETSANVGTQTSYGGSAKINGSIAFDRLKLDFFGYYTYIDGDLDGGQLLYTAKHTAKAGITLVGKRFAITPRVMFRDRSYSAEVDQNGENISNSAYFLVNLFVRYTAFKSETSNISIFADVTNLLDRRFHHISNNGPEGLVLAPQDPLRAKAGVQLKF